MFFIRTKDTVGARSAQVLYSYAAVCKKLNTNRRVRQIDLHYEVALIGLVARMIGRSSTGQFMIAETTPIAMVSIHIS